MVGVERSRLAPIAVARAAELANLVGAARLHLLHILRPPLAWTPPHGDALSMLHQQTLTEARRFLDAVLVPATNALVTREVRFGGAAEELANTATEVSADAIIVATHERGKVARFALGSVASALVRGATCPVFVVGADRNGPSPLKIIVAAVDLSAVAGRILEAAGTIAKESGAALLVLSIHEEPEAICEGEPSPRLAKPEEVESLRLRYREALTKLVNASVDSSIDTCTTVIDGEAAALVILEQANSARADLLVLGSAGYSAWQRLFLGSTAARVIADAKCAVLVLPH